jgi:pheromone shutdown protein TraB
LGDTETLAERKKSAKAVIKVGTVVYVAWLGGIAFVANLSGENQSTITLAYATISGVILALYSILEKRKQLSVMFTALVSILVALSSSIISLDKASLSTGVFAGFASFSKNEFVASTVVFAFSTYYFVSSISMEPSLGKKRQSAKSRPC